MLRSPHLEITRQAYDQMAQPYADFARDPDNADPCERAFLGAFADLVRTQAPSRSVVDVGCGPGHLTALLARQGLAARGVDLSPAMIALARQARPTLPFAVGSMFELGDLSGTLGGVLAHYSIIHTPPDEVPAAFAEFARVLAPGGYLLAAFQSGLEPGRDWAPFDHRVTRGYRWSIDALARLLGAAGLLEVARLRTSAGPRNRFAGGYLIARRVS